MAGQNDTTLNKSRPSGQRPEQKLRFLDQVRAAIPLCHYSIRTEDAYVQPIRRCILFHNKRHPLLLSHLATEMVSGSTQNLTLCAIVFLYKAVLNRAPGQFTDTVCAKRGRRLPSVLTHDETKSPLSRLRHEERIIGNVLDREAGLLKSPPTACEV